MKKQLHIRASDLLARQLDQLSARWNTNEAETVSLAMDRAWQAEHQQVHFELAQHSHAICPWCGIDQGEDAA